MTRIGVLSDTHGHLPDSVFEHFKNVDEIWHIGDIGTIQVADALEQFKPMRIVCGNIDGGELRRRYPLDLVFMVEGVKVYMTHIGGYPNRYSRHAYPVILRERPKLFLSGHSHILKVMRDGKLNLLHMNPGACGKTGIHKVSTLLRFEIDGDKIQGLEVIELA